jgi:ABC-type spermidine/putrescine transport system permease subunit II
MWDPSAIIALVSILGAVILGGILSIIVSRNKKVNAFSLKLIIAIPALLLITGLKVYAQIGSDALTFVFGAIIGYILGGQPLQMVSPSGQPEVDSPTE